LKEKDEKKSFNFKENDNVETTQTIVNNPEILKNKKLK